MRIGWHFVDKIRSTNRSAVATHGNKFHRSILTSTTFSVSVSHISSYDSCMRWCRHENVRVLRMIFGHNSVLFETWRWSQSEFALASVRWCNRQRWRQQRLRRSPSYSRVLCTILGLNDWIAEGIAEACDVVRIFQWTMTNQSVDWRLLLLLLFMGFCWTDKSMKRQTIEQHPNSRYSTHIHAFHSRAFRPIGSNWIELFILSAHKKSSIYLFSRFAAVCVYCLYVAIGVHLNVLVHQMLSSAWYLTILWRHFGRHCAHAHAKQCFSSGNVLKYSSPLKTHTYMLSPFVAGANRNQFIHLFSWNE